MVVVHADYDGPFRMGDASPADFTHRAFDAARPRETASQKGRGMEPEDRLLIQSITIEIDTPASVVWDVLTDIEAYGEWNPFCVGIKTTFEMGSLVDMLVHDPNMDTLRVVQERLCAYDKPTLLAWNIPESQNEGYTARRDQIVTPLGPTRCSYVTTDRFGGGMGQAVIDDNRAWIIEGFNAMCHALKTRAETIYAAQRQNGKT
jgi:Polyketide cyclase / dehydrase and lipid transport